jgi:hypothetical protein
MLDFAEQRDFKLNWESNGIADISVFGERE